MMMTAKVRSRPVWKTTTLDNGVKVETILVSARDMGFRKNTTLGRFCDKAQSMGFQFCPLEIVWKLEKRATAIDLDHWFVIDRSTAWDFELWCYVPIGTREGGVSTASCRRNGNACVDVDERYVFIRLKQVV